MKTQQVHDLFVVPGLGKITSSVRKFFIATCAGLPIMAASAQEPRVDSWFTTYSGKYARIYATTADLNSGNAAATWNRNSLAQSLPAYCGVQEIYSSDDWVYIRTTGLGSQVMGPWYLNAGKTTLFPNLPVNQRVFYRIPKNSTIPETKTLTGLGAIGYFVDGVAMFDNRDAFYWNGSSEVNGSGFWNRDAFVNESVTFDPALAHQQQTGTYHYHANPIALRYLQGDNILFNSATKTYSENVTNSALKHSPILGWVRDGLPIYGPYGYSVATNPASGVRRMVSGFVARNGQNGTDDLSVTGASRSSVPAWAQRRYSGTPISGPTVSTTYPFGRYLEDNAFLGDLTNSATGQPYHQGVDFDLDEFNGRFCVTPEFPEGTYAYFVTITSNGAPAFPYNIGRAFYGSPTGGDVTSLDESVVTNFVGGANAALRLNNPVASNNSVTLVWSASEGGAYRVESTADFSEWRTNAENISAVGSVGSFSGNTTDLQNFYRVTRTALADYDDVTTSGGAGNGILSVSPTSGNPGATFTLTINLDSAVNPPPQQAPVNSVTVGSIAGSNRVHVSQTQVTATISIPANAATGPQTVTVIFPGPPDNPTATVTYTLTDGFTIN